MKKFIFIIVLIVFFYSQVYPQYEWSSPVRMTSGYIDKNPQFATRTTTQTSYQYKNEFLVFERHSTGSTGIFYMSVSDSGISNPQELSMSTRDKRNPIITYISLYQINSSEFLRHSMVMWEEYNNGRWDVYGRNYYQGVWNNNVYLIDSSAGNKTSINLFLYDSINCGYAFEKNGDIYYGIYNTQTNTISGLTNLTEADTAYCTNPRLGTVGFYGPSSRYTIISYEKSKPDGLKAIYYRKALNNTSWSTPDTIAYFGDNRLDKINVYYGSYLVSFSSKRGSNYTLYYNRVPPNYNSNSQYLLSENINYQTYNNRNLYYIDPPIITDYLSICSAFEKKGINDTKIMLKNYYNFDSINVGNALQTPNITMNQGLYYPSYKFIGCVVYQKDSALTTSLYYIKKIFNITDVKKISENIPENFQLYQNFPNPFNPVTKIKFEIPVNAYITLNVYDEAGRKINTLVSSKLSRGIYEVNFNANNLSSGIYYYSLSVDGVLRETKKAILLK